MHIPDGADAIRLQAVERCDIPDAPLEAHFDRLTRLAARLFGVAAGITVRSENRLRLISCSEMGVGEWGPEASFCEQALAADGVFVVEDTRDDARFDTLPSAYGAGGYRFYAGLSLETADGGDVGTFFLMGLEPRAFDMQEEHLLRDLAAMAVDEIELRHALPANTNAVHGDKALFAAVVAVQNEIAGAGPNLEEIMELVVQRAHALTRAEGTGIGRIEGGDLVYYKSIGTVRDYEGLRIGIDATLTGQCVRTGEVVYSPDARQDDRIDLDMVPALDIRSVIITPLQTQGEVVGVLNVTSAEPNAFTTAHVQALELLASSIAVAWEQAEARRTIRESDLRYRALVAQTAEAIYFVDPETMRVVEANSAFCDLLGYTGDEINELTVYDIVAHARNSVAAHTHRVQAERLIEVERMWRCKDGTLLDVQATISAIEQQGREMLFIVARDVTEKKHVAEQLVWSEARLRAITSNAGDVIEIIDADRIVRYVSGACKEVFGYLPEQVVGRSAFTNAHPDDLASVKAGFAESLQRPGQVIETEYRIQDPTGVWRHLSVHGRNLINQPGIDGVLCVIRDVTERRHAEAEVQRLRTFYESTLDALPIQIVVWDREGRYLYMNPAAIGDDAVREWTIGKTTLDYGRRRGRDPALFERRYRWIQHVIETKEEGQIEEEMITRSGTSQYLVRAASPVRGPDGEVVQVVGYSIDLTERKRFEEELVAAKETAEEMVRLKSAFLANMSHEIRTPLTAILGFAEVLADEVEGEQREFVELIQQGGQRLSETLNSVLDLARLEAGGFELALEDVPVASVLHEVARLMGQRAAAKGLELRMELPGIPLFVRADRAALGRVFTNLLSNAVKFTEEGWVAVRGRVDEHAVYVEVADTGIGMDEAFLCDLFEEFRQESVGLDRSHEGTGLGLSITKRLVNLMNGEIRVESRKGNGSTFTVSLPRKDVPDAD